MKLSDLNQYGKITIQCHDNPDADAIASGYALCQYFKSLDKTVRFLYAGRNKIQKSNLILMLEHLEISVDYIENVRDFLEQEGGCVKGLLLTVDCQYGAGNVTYLPAEDVAIIDHHQMEIRDVEKSEINPHFGSCSTLVWKMLRDAGWQVRDAKLGTALYYGLYTDTNQFSEIFNPLDMDMRETIPFEKSLITMFRNSNLSLHELEIAGVALIRHIYNDDYRYAIVKSQPCDPNILGIISDFLNQVAEVDCCVVYNEMRDGYKFSVRSCVREVRANELAAFLAEGVGSGGGHREKAGGFINKALYEEAYPTLHTEAFFSERLNDYYDNCEIIYADKYEIDTSDMPSYAEKKVPLGYVTLTDIVPPKTPVTIRTLEGDTDMVADTDLMLLIDVKGDVHLSQKGNFECYYEITETPLSKGEAYMYQTSVYHPTIRNQETGEVLQLMDYAKICTTNGKMRIRAKKLTKRVKVFTVWDKEKYMSGKIGDYLAVKCDDKQDIFVVEQDVFFRIYEADRSGLTK